MNSSKKDIDREAFIASRQVPMKNDIPDDVDRSFFKNQLADEDFEKTEHPIIPPIGIAEPELVEKSLSLIDNPKELQEHIDEMERYKQESPYETVKREALSHSARALEGLGGFWGDMDELLSTLTGSKFQAHSEEEGQEQKPVNMEEIYENFPQLRGMPTRQKLPTTEQLRGFTKEKTGQYLEPKGEFGKATQEFSQDVGSFFAMPLGGFWSKFIVPLTGQVGKQTAKSMGASENEQDLVKMGAMGLASLMHFGNANVVAGNAMREAENMVPRGVAFDARPTEQALQRIRNSNWFRSGPTPAKNPAMHEIQRIEAQIANGQIDGHMAMQLRQDLNAARRNMGGFDVQVRADRRQALRYINQVDDALRASMEQYGRRVNPEWWHNYNQANQAWGVTQRSRALADYIHENGGGKLVSNLGKNLFPAAFSVAASSFPATMATIGTGAAIGKSIQVLNRMVRSPVIRNHYLNVLRQAATGNAKATADALKKFDAVSKKFEEKIKSGNAPRQKGMNVEILNEEYE